MRGLRKTSYELGLTFSEKERMIRISKVVTDEEEAELWEEEPSSPTNNELTQVLVPYGFDYIEAIFARERCELLMYNVNLDFITNKPKLHIETSYGRIEIDINNIEESFEALLDNIEYNKFIHRVDGENSRCFSTPTYRFVNEDNSEMTIELWLNSHGHRLNQLHIFYK